MSSLATDYWLGGSRKSAKVASGETERKREKERERELAHLNSLALLLSIGQDL